MNILIKYWLKFKKWKPKVKGIALCFIILSLIAGVAEQKDWFFPLLWLEGIKINYIDLVSVMVPQLMILKRLYRKDDPS